MIEIERALQLIFSHTNTLSGVTTDLLTARGHVLAEDVISDTNTPPFDKALMDGYAVRAADIVSADTTLPVVGTVTAGEATSQSLPPTTAMLIMTGATLPTGADAVVMRELVTANENDSVTIEQYPVNAEQNLMRTGQICRSGDLVLPAGHPVSAAEVGVLAETGHDSIKIVPRPSVAVLTTGNELVPIGQPIQPGQIRNSNGPMICSMASELTGSVIDLGIGRDDHDELKRLVNSGLETDVLVLSGGVSAGDLDLVPAVLKSCGVSEVFHKVRVKPGKPIWFGVGENGTLVFGLPGNPVSSLVCFRLFVQPAIQQLAGIKRSAQHLQSATLQDKFLQRGDRPTYFPAFVRFSTEPNGDNQAQLNVLPWLGSSDLHTFTKANCLAFFPAGQTEFAAGSKIKYLPLAALGAAPLTHHDRDQHSTAD